jgi:curved DNA-binding protein CbpA
MAKSLYDLLEVSASASAEAIRASYERLSAKLDPDAPQNSGNPDCRLQYEAVKEAFLTLGNPARRARYDSNQMTRIEPAYRSSIELVPGFWTTSRLMLLAAVLLLGGGWYYQHKSAEAKLAAERAIAESRAKEAEAVARAEAEAAAVARAQAQHERDLERQRAYQESRNRSDFERSRREVEREQRSREHNERIAQDRETREQQNEARRKEYERQRTEAASVNEARRRVAREREELCRMERARYGKAISC